MVINYLLTGMILQGGSEHFQVNKPLSTTNDLKRKRSNIDHLHQEIPV